MLHLSHLALSLREVPSISLISYSRQIIQSIQTLLRINELPSLCCLGRPLRALALYHNKLYIALVATDGCSLHVILATLYVCTTAIAMGHFCRSDNSYSIVKVLYGRSKGVIRSYYYHRAINMQCAQSLQC